MRREPGKCGWASGELLALFVGDIFGIRYDATKQKITFKPLDVVQGYTAPNFQESDDAKTDSMETTIIQRFLSCSATTILKDISL